eukprot:5110072-Pyramimonas_sp.AAC.1
MGLKRRAVQPGVEGDEVFRWCELVCALALVDGDEREELMGMTETWAARAAVHAPCQFEKKTAAWLAD